jgi:pimeloyl-ACP methyl ester carboxylesterase
MEAEKIQLREHKKLSGLKIMERDIADLDVLYWSSDNELNYQPVVRLMEIHPGEFDAVGGSTNSGKPGWLINFHHYSMLTKRKQVIHIFAYILQDQSHDPFTFLFSHGNATDLGYSWPHAVRLANRLGCNVVMYDYSGYGQSTGKPTEDNTYADIRACYQFCTEKLKVSPHRLILYGQSVGSGPSVDLLCDKNYPVVGAVLHSGLASGLRILGNWQWEPGKSPFFDLYRNVDKLSKLEKQKCIYIMHGMRDVEVPANHGEMLQTTKPDAGNL